MKLSIIGYRRELKPKQQEYYIRETARDKGLGLIRITKREKFRKWTMPDICTLILLSSLYSGMMANGEGEEEAEDDYKSIKLY